MIGYDWTEAKFFWFYNYMLASLILCDLDTKLSDLRNLHVFLPQSIWNFFSGNASGWTLYGSITSQVGDQDLIEHSIVQNTGLVDTGLKKLLKDGSGFE
ncbi:hypothetical protein YC2023_049304 [Brassica napus]